MNLASRDGLQVLALLDDLSGANLALELSAALAATMQRDLSIVYVESTSALLAAALPFTQSLPHAAAAWVPFSPQDVEDGFRQQASRLRELAASIAPRHSVQWSLRVMRGQLPSAALDLRTESDLLLQWQAPPTRQAPSVSSPTVRQARASPGDARKPHVHVLRTQDDAGERAHKVGQRLAQALGSSLQVHPVQSVQALQAQLKALCAPAARSHCDLLVLPRVEVPQQVSEQLHCPVLWVA